MEKEKSKPRRLSVRGLLRVAICIVGLMCVVTLLRSLLWPFFYRSKSIPGEFYRLTGDSYLSGFYRSPANENHSSIEDTWTESTEVTHYWKKFQDKTIPQVWAVITFSYYDDLYFSRLAYDYRIDDYSEPDYTPVIHDLLKTPDFKSGCVWAENLKFCMFVARYNLCFIEVISYVESPLVLVDDYKQLIEDYIDPQMAAWDVCYGRDSS